MIIINVGIRTLALYWILVSIEAFPMQPTNQRTVTTNMKSSNTPQTTDESYQVKTWNPLRLLVLKLGLTEPAWTSPWNYQKKQRGTFQCAYCGKELFDANSKYDSGSGWPSFWRTSSNGAVRLVREFDGRVECSCNRCKSHLGHVFMDGPLKQSVDANLLSSIPESDPKGSNANSRLPRFCINGAALRYENTLSGDLNEGI